MSIVAPESGVITEQNVTAAAGVKTLDNSPNLFTISDLSRVWILCDVNENDLHAVRVGDTAEIRADGYPEQVLDGHVGNIGAILDPNLRTAKVRVELANPGLLRVGMFVTATFQGQQKETRVTVPAGGRAAPARSRLGVRGDRRGHVRAAGSWSPAPSSPAISRKSCRDSRRASAWWRTRSSCRSTVEQ